MELIEVTESIEDLARAGGTSEFEPLSVAGQTTLEASMCDAPGADEKVEISEAVGAHHPAWSLERNVGCKRSVSIG